MAAVKNSYCYIFNGTVQVCKKQEKVWRPDGSEGLLQVQGPQEKVIPTKRNQVSNLGVKIAPPAALR